MSLLESLIASLSSGFTSTLASVQRWLFEAWIQPLLFSLELTHYAEQSFDATEWFLLGLLEVGFLALVLGTLERWFPAERQSDRASRRVDILYTLLHRLGLFPLLAFVLFMPVFGMIEEQMRLHGLARPNLEQFFAGLSSAPAWVGFFQAPIVSFFLYLIILDFADYWIHRAQHYFESWWQLHALHHSQREMSFWSDNRNHLIDDLLRDALMAGLALLLGASPAQYVGLLVASRMLQSLQHANLRWRFGTPGGFLCLGERLLVSPSFHRLHHGIGVGHEGAHRGCNFAVLFPLWDMIFRTADFQVGFVPTGVRDQLQGHEYGRGFWQQQWLGCKRVLNVWR